MTTTTQPLIDPAKVARIQGQVAQLSEEARELFALISENEPTDERLLKARDLAAKIPNSEGIILCRLLEECCTDETDEQMLNEASRVWMGLGDGQIGKPSPAPGPARDWIGITDVKWSG